MTELFSDGKLGKRLKRIELYNWGQFRDTVTVFDFNKDSTLIIGRNGTGKTTMVDALNSLLVQHSLLRYNGAAESGSIRDGRNQLRYAWGLIGTKEIGGIKTDVYISKNYESFSVILAMFEDDMGHQTTLMTLFYSTTGRDPSLSHIRAIADTDMNIKEHFLHFTRNKAEFKKALSNYPIAFYDSKEYFAKVREALNIPDKSAASLFASAAYLKSVDKVSDFIEEYFLPANVDSVYYNAIVASKESAEKQREDIRREKQKLEILETISERSETLAARRKNETRRVRQLELVGDYVRKFALEDVREKIQDLEKGKRESEKKCEIAKKNFEKAVKYRNSLGSDNEAEAIKDKIESLEKQETAAKNKREEFARLFGEEPDNEGKFNELVKARVDVDLDYDEIQREKFNCERELDQVRETSRKLVREISFAESNNTKMPYEKVEARNSIVKSLGISKDELPFIGEQMEITDKEWSDAIEALLSQFSCSFLVPEKYYAMVTKAVDDYDGKGVVQFWKMSHEPVSTKQEYGDEVYTKINVKDNEYGKWVMNHLRRDFSHRCLSADVFAKTTEKALTVNGQVRRGLFHRRDVEAIHRNIRYIGFSNQDRVNELKSKKRETDEKLFDLNRTYNELGQKLELCRMVAEARRWANANSFADIDVVRISSELYELNERLASMDNDMSLRRKEADEKLRRCDDIYRAYDKDVASISTRLDTLMNQESGIVSQFDESEIMSDNEELIEDLRDFIEKKVTDIPRKITIDNYGGVIESIKESLNNSKEGYHRNAEADWRVIEKGMEDYLRKYPERQTSLAAREEYIGDFIKEKEQIVKEGLPDQEKAHKELVTNVILANIAQYGSEIATKREEIEQCIEENNKFLEKHPFRGLGQMRITCKCKTTPQINSFMNGLKKAQKLGLMTPSELTPEIESEIYDIYQNVLTGDSASLIDVRKHFDYAISFVKNGEEIQRTITMFSGGEGIRTAYFLLLAAYMNRFRFNTDESVPFRLLVIDEAAAKFDDRNAREALEAFKDAGFQMIYIAPHKNGVAGEFRPFVTRVTQLWCVEPADVPGKKLTLTRSMSWKEFANENE